jgi:hypothetical protein
MFVNVFWKVYFVFGMKKYCRDIKVKTIFSILCLMLFVNSFVLTIENKRQKAKI